MNVLSLFDGMSCGRVALERAGIPVDNYYAAEIDKYAIEIAKKNYPDTQHLGDVTRLYGFELPKIDLLIGGSPCQGFSFAGKKLAFDDPRSKLFFEFVRLIDECNPEYFLLENVRMKKEHQDIISKYMGVEPIRINSNLVSAQNRDRWYWTNIPGIEQPEDRGVMLTDILEKGSTDRDKSLCITATYHKKTPRDYFLKSRGQIVFTKNYLQYDASGKGYKSQDQRAYYLKGKHGALPANGGGSKVKVLLDKEKLLVRKLTPIECERLQTLPDNYTEGVSNTQRYKMIGNGWTVDVVAHIFDYLYLLT